MKLWKQEGKEGAHREFRMLPTSPWLEAISTVTVHFGHHRNSITFKSLKLLAMGFAEYEEAEGRG
ncbi:hypothetical protein Bca52824_039866 [Brassica carinata]|uniref:Uncharacterized protein n=1 Tax=Brassica carinata TaxID=52824 RepID=A0A8X7RSF2_BRACI|nr:hypothetical protein Bca52824_039866 [Brassica carinata]